MEMYRNHVNEDGVLSLFSCRLKCKIKNGKRTVRVN